MKKIAIIGAPGSGKTTIAFGLFYNLKTLQKKVEIVRELIKDKVYQNLKFGSDGFDILNTLEQKELEEIVEKAPGFDYIICEAPLCNGYFYSFFYKKKEEWPVLKKIAKSNINSYDLIIFVEHLPFSKDFETFGRKESKTVSLKLEKMMQKELINLGYKGQVLKVNQATNIQKILYTILDPKSYLLKK
jgi:nicotinamide riboside kinase